MTPTIADHKRDATQYPICGKCRTVWKQRGNRTGHCAKCHQTFEGLTLFDRHQLLDDHGHVICRPAETILLGKAQIPLENVAGVWQGPRMDEETKARRFGATRQHHA